MLGLCGGPECPPPRPRSPPSPSLPFPCRWLYRQLPKAALGLCSPCTQEPPLAPWSPPNFLTEPQSPLGSLASDCVLHQPSPSQERQIPQSLPGEEKGWEATAVCKVKRVTNENPHFPLSQCEPTAVQGSATHHSPSPQPRQIKICIPNLMVEKQDVMGTGSQGLGSKEGDELISPPQVPGRSCIHGRFIRVTGAAAAW